MRIQFVVASILAVTTMITATGFALTHRVEAATYAADVAARESVVLATSGNYAAENVVYMDTGLRFGDRTGPIEDIQPLMYRPAQFFTENSFFRTSFLPLPIDSPTATPIPPAIDDEMTLSSDTLPIDSEPVDEPSDRISAVDDQIGSVLNHIVARGDTLWAIGVEYGTPWPELAELNSLMNPDLIYPGQAIWLSNPNTERADSLVSANVSDASSNESLLYTVEPGDTLSDIGRRHGIDWPIIADVNAIPNPDLIYAGDSLVLSTQMKQSARVLANPVRQVTQSVRYVAPTVAAPVSAPIVRQVVPQQIPPVIPGTPIQSGIATWYGPGFEGNVTYCGQIYDSRQLTAASNTLPCGSVVTVQNQSTGAMVTVTVTDRGGFGHAMDLSHAAFSAIANPSAGVAPIVVVAAK